MLVKDVLQLPQMCISCGRRSGVPRDTPLRSIVCGPCWFASGGDTTASELVGRPQPATTTVPDTITQWLRAVRGSNWFRARRVDCARKLRIMVVVLARHADWEDLTGFPTWERLMDYTGWSRSQMASWLAELQRQGFLLRTEGGSTPRFRPMALAHVEGNRAAVYQLRLPAVPGAVDAPGSADQPITRTPTRLSKDPFSRELVLPTRARKSIHSPTEPLQPVAQKDGPTGPRFDEQRGRYFDLRVPTSPAQMLAAAAELRAADRALWRLSPRWIRALFRPWWRAGWTNSDLLHALDHAPAVGEPRRLDRCPAEQLRRPDGWVRHRMRLWWTDAGPAAAPRVWEAARQRVELEHGKAAGARLPYGESRLQPEHLTVAAGERDQAAAQLVRQWARELHERRNAPTPQDQIPDEASRRRRWQEACEGIRRRTSSPPAAPSPATSPPAPTTEAVSAEQAQSAYERALEKARREGHAARPRPRLRRERGR